MDKHEEEKQASEWIDRIEELIASVIDDCEPYNALREEMEKAGYVPAITFITCVVKTEEDEIGESLKKKRVKSLVQKGEVLARTFTSEDVERMRRDFRIKLE
jgi:hypothetical protein